MNLKADLSQGDYWAVNQILSKNLHNADEQCLKYTTELMDKLEQTKTQYADEDAVTDDIVGQAYVEQFGAEVFQRAENAVHADQATRQTADTYQAAATFLEVNNIWGPLSAEIASQIKYAKYHAVRILKALKAGEDPNASNPKEPVPDELEDLKMEDAPAAGSRFRPHVVDDEDEEQAPMTRGIPAQHDPAPPSLPDTPMPAPDAFDDPELSIPSVPTTHPFSPPPPTEPPTTTLPDPPPAPPQAPKPKAPALAPRVIRTLPPQAAPTPGTGSAPVDEEAVMQAQKHAKWAISALNFEDVPTAISELRLALQQLGGG